MVQFCKLLNVTWVFLSCGNLKRSTLKISVYEFVSVCMSVQHVHAWGPWRPEEASGSPGSGVNSCKLPHGWWDSDPTWVLLTSLQSNFIKTKLLCLAGPKSIYPLSCEEQLVRWIIASSGARASCLGSPHCKRQIWAPLQTADLGSTARWLQCQSITLTTVVQMSWALTGVFQVRQRLTGHPTLTCLSSPTFLSIS